jgi:NAD(P)-dependent dehydrogenase (short-subunit alcohol dehydrogenase family)
MWGAMTKTNRCVVITGGGGALGSAVARRLVNDGASVALFDSAHGAERARALAAELGRARALEVDVANAAAWSEALARVEAELGPTTGATLIAGAWHGGKPLAEEEDATWRAMVGANLETAHASLRALLPGMVARGAGSIVVIGSRAVERPWTSANASAYAATKAAVVALAQAAAAEVVDRGVRINAVLPSTLDTPANRKAMPDVDPTTWVSLESAAGVIAFLLSDGARDVSGAALPLYGRA